MRCGQRNNEDGSCFGIVNRCFGRNINVNSGLMADKQEALTIQGAADRKATNKDRKALEDEALPPGM